MRSRGTSDVSKGFGRFRKKRIGERVCSPSSRSEPKKKVPEWAVRFTAKYYLVKMVAALKEHAEKS